MRNPTRILDTWVEGGGPLVALEYLSARHESLSEWLRRSGEWGGRKGEGEEDW